MRVLVVGLGNEYAGDDAAGVLAIRALQGRLPPAADVVESAASGLALLEVFAGYEHAVVVDSIRTGRHPAGTVLDLGIADVGPVVAPSLHHAGLPELAAVAARLGIPFPRQTRVFAIEVTARPAFGEPLSRPVAEALGELDDRVRAQLAAWCAEDVGEAAGAPSGDPDSPSRHVSASRPSTTWPPRLGPATLRPESSAPERSPGARRSRADVVRSCEADVHEEGSRRGCQRSRDQRHDSGGSPVD